LETSRKKKPRRRLSHYISGFTSPMMWVGAVAREFVFVFYLHRESFGLFVRLSLLLRKPTPLSNNLVPGIHLVHFAAFACKI
jgi:hypothetical protein